MVVRLDVHFYFVDLGSWSPDISSRQVSSKAGCRGGSMYLLGDPFTGLSGKCLDRATVSRENTSC